MSRVGSRRNPDSTKLLNPIKLKLDEQYWKRPQAVYLEPYMAPHERRPTHFLLVRHHHQSRQTQEGEEDLQKPHHTSKRDAAGDGVSQPDKGAACQETQHLKSTSDPDAQSAEVAGGTDPGSGGDGGPLGEKPSNREDAEREEPEG